VGVAGLLEGDKETSKFVDKIILFLLYILEFSSSKQMSRVEFIIIRAVIVQVDVGRGWAKANGRRS